MARSVTVSNEVVDFALSAGLPVASSADLKAAREAYLAAHPSAAKTEKRAYTPKTREILVLAVAEDGTMTEIHSETVENTAFAVWARVQRARFGGQNLIFVEEIPDEG